MTYEEFLTRARQLRAEVAESEYEFLSFLAQVEQDESVWKTGQARSSFVEVLRVEHLCDAGRFQEFKEAVAAFGAEVVRSIGLDAAKEGIRLADAKNRKRFIMEASRAREHNEAPLSEQQAKRIRLALTPPSEVILAHEAKVTRIQELERENAALRKEVAKLKARIVQLEGRKRAA